MSQHKMVPSGLWLVIAALAVPAWAQETIDSVQKKLTEAVGRIKSVSFKMTMSESKAGEAPARIDMTGTCEYAKAGGKFKWRTDVKTDTVTPSGGAESKTTTALLTVCDGDFMYTLSDTNGQRSAMKMNLDPSWNALDIKAVFERKRKDYNLKLLPDEQVDGKDCFVIEQTPKNAAVQHGERLFYAKDIGVALKVVTLDKDGRPAGTATMTDVKVDPTIPPDHFVFNAPGGVKVVDATKGGSPGRRDKPGPQ